MPARRRPLQVIVLAALLAGCGMAPTPLVSPTPTGAPTAGAVSPGAVSPAATTTPLVSSASPPVVPTPSPTGTPQVSPPPLGTGGFTTPIPADPAAAWTGIRWRKLAATDPLAHVRSVTRWRGGFVATGDLAVTGTSARTKVWVWSLPTAGRGSRSAPTCSVRRPSSSAWARPPTGSSPSPSRADRTSMSGSLHGPPPTCRPGPSRVLGSPGPRRTEGRGPPIRGRVSRCHDR